jgi:hypothetical protein
MALNEHVHRTTAMLDLLSSLLHCGRALQCTSDFTTWADMLISMLTLYMVCDDFTDLQGARSGGAKSAYRQACRTLPPLDEHIVDLYDTFTAVLMYALVTDGLVKVCSARTFIHECAGACACHTRRSRQRIGSTGNCVTA